MQIVKIPGRPGPVSILRESTKEKKRTRERGKADSVSVDISPPPSAVIIKTTAVESMDRWTDYTLVAGFLVLQIRVGEGALLSSLGVLG